MSKIELRGVIVPSIYDSEWSQDYIVKGLITPESFFRRQLAEAATDEPLSVYINSPGGSVFAAYEMINAVREWKVANKQPVEITIGAMAASAASMFAVSVAGAVRAHQNAKMMFHGASSETWGGKGAHEDTADLLGKINADIQQVLIQRFKMDPDTVAEWFAEGRMGWLTAEEMLAAGIVSEIIADDAEVIEFDDAAVAAIDEHGLDIAAVLETKPEDTDDESGESAGEGEGDTSEGEGEGAGEGDAGEGEGTEGDEGGTPEGTPDSGEEYQRGIADGASAGRAELAAEFGEKINSLKAALQGAEDRASQFQSEKDKALAQLALARKEMDERTADLRSQLDEATEKLRKFVSGALSFSPAVETWEDAMKDSGGDYVKAKAKYPELCKQFRAEQNRKG